MTVRVVNTGKKPFEFMWDGKMFPALNPGDVTEMPEWLANHAIKKSAFLDPNTGMQDTYLKIAAQVDPKSFRYSCPMSKMGLCDATSFASLRELQDHISVHEQERAKKSASSRADIKL
jgi:hypothetical protein